MIFYDYFQSYKDYFWQWEENAEVIAIPKENTIAYTSFITEVLERLSHQGVPPFGSLLLAIIATNPKGRGSIDAVYNILSTTLKTTDDVRLSKAIDLLNLLSKMPESFKSGKKRILLLQAVFENCHNIVSVKNSRSIINTFNAGKFDTTKLSLQKEFSDTVLYNNFRTIELLKNKFSTVDDIIAKIASLPEIPEEIIEIEKISEQETETADLNDQLIKNPKTFHVGSLIKRIWAGLNIPVHSALPSQQPLGGVSDLTNKGDFDKLLISEFANEDIIFLSRLANNEALFISREIPPVNDDLERIILIDVSLKNWGTPKAIAFATMLAIAKHPKSKINCSAFVIGDHFYPVITDSVETIIDGLQILEGTLNSAKGLNAFFKEFSANKKSEIFFITEPTTLKQSSMIKALSEHQALINYWIYTDADGNIDIYKKQQGSKKHIQHILLPLEELWKKEIKTNPVFEESERSKVFYPILFRTLNIKKFMTTSDGQIFMVNSFKSLLRFYDPKLKNHDKGWEVVLEKLPFNSGEFEIGLLSNGEYLLLVFNMQNRELTLINLNTADKKMFVFDKWKSSHANNFVFYEDKFYHINNGGGWEISFEGIVNFDLRKEPQNVTWKSFITRQEELYKIKPDFYPFHNVLKKIRTIFINEHNQLVFNTHGLTLNHEHFRIDTSYNLAKKTEAKKLSDTEFMFDDGSRIQINRAGMLILKSNNPDIPVIYIPSLLNVSLGIATKTAFAGNDYYYKEPQFEVKLLNAGDQKLAVIRQLKQYTNIGLKEAKNLVELAPKKILNYTSQTNAANIKSDLEAEGATVEIKAVDYNTINVEKMNSHLFYEKFLTPFIYNITSYGAKN